MTEALSPIPSPMTFERVFARPVAAPDLQHGRLVYLSWRAPKQGDRLVQVYDNGRWVGSTASPIERDCWLLIDPEVHHEIELIAADSRDASTPSPKALRGNLPATRPSATFELLRDNRLPVDALLTVKIDADQTNVTPLFSADAARGGFGSVFGEGGFGFDAATGPGLGQGQLGYGPLGTDGNALRWEGHGLSEGSHTVELSLVDREGRAVANPAALTYEIDRLPMPVTDLQLRPDLTLTWT